jgi:hypothetical protein
VSDALRYIAEFASLAGIVFVAECVVPIAAFTYAYLTLSWRLEQAESGSLPSAPPAPVLPPPSPNRDEFGGLIRLPLPSARENENRQPRQRRRKHYGRRQ